MQINCQLKPKLSSKDIDKVDTDAIVLLFFNDEKPLRGATGLIDWRMHGAISDFIVNEKINGNEGEAILIVPKKRIRGKKILMVGLGDSPEFTESALKKTSGDLISQLVKIGVKKFHLAMPPKQFTTFDTAHAARYVVEGMNSMIDEKKINTSGISLTISLDYADLSDTRQALDDLEKR